MAKKKKDMIKVEMKTEELQYILMILAQVPVKGPDAQEEAVALYRRLEVQLPPKEEDAGS